MQLAKAFPASLPGVIDALPNGAYSCCRKYPFPSTKELALKTLSFLLFSLLAPQTQAHAFPSDRCKVYTSYVDCWIRGTTDGALSPEFAAQLKEVLAQHTVQELKINLSNGSENDLRPAKTGWLKGEQLTAFLAEQPGAAKIETLSFLFTGPVLGGRFHFTLPALKTVSVRSWLGEWRRENEGSPDEAERNMCVMPTAAIASLQLDFTAAPQLQNVAVEGCLPFAHAAAGGDIVLPAKLKELSLDGVAAFASREQTRPLQVTGAASRVGRIFIAPALLNSQASYIRKDYNAPFAADYLQASGVSTDQLVLTMLLAPARPFFAGLPKAAQVWIGVSDREAERSSVGFRLGHGLGDPERYHRAQPMPIELSAATLGNQVKRLQVAGADSISFAVRDLPLLERASIDGLSQAQNLPVLATLEFSQWTDHFGRKLRGEDQPKQSVLVDLPSLASLSIRGEGVNTVQVLRAASLQVITAEDDVAHLSLVDVASLESLYANTSQSFVVQNAPRLKVLAMNWRPHAIYDDRQPHRSVKNFLSITGVPELRSLALAYRLDRAQMGIVAGRPFSFPSVATADPDSPDGWMPLLDPSAEQAVVDAPNVTELFLQGESITYQAPEQKAARHLGTLFPKLGKLDLVVGANHLGGGNFLGGLPASVRDLSLLPTWVEYVCGWTGSCYYEPAYLKPEVLNSLAEKLNGELGAQGFTPAMPPAAGRLRYVR